MGHPDLRVADKIFAGLPVEDKHSVNLKSTAVNVDALVREDPATYRNAWGGKWLGVNLERVNRAKLSALIEEAWSLTAPRKLREEHNRGDGETAGPPRSARQSRKRS